jgi:hypothetical protein
MSNRLDIRPEESHILPPEPVTTFVSSSRAVGTVVAFVARDGKWGGRREDDDVEQAATNDDGLLALKLAKQQTSHATVNEQKMTRLGLAFLLLLPDRHPCCAS